jgi:hypothetical protein
MCSLIPRAYLNSYFLAKIRTNREKDSASVTDAPGVTGVAGVAGAASVGVDIDLAGF